MTTTSFALLQSLLGASRHDQGAFFALLEKVAELNDDDGWELLPPPMERYHPFWMLGIDVGTVEALATRGEDARNQLWQNSMPDIERALKRLSC